MIEIRRAYLEREVAQDGEFSRDLWILLNKKVNQNSGVSDYQGLLKELQVMRQIFQTDTLNETALMQE